MSRSLCQHLFGWFLLGSGCRRLPLASMGHIPAGPLCKAESDSVGKPVRVSTKRRAPARNRKQSALVGRITVVQMPNLSLGCILHRPRPALRRRHRLILVWQKWAVWWKLAANASRRRPGMGEGPGQHNGQSEAQPPARIGSGVDSSMLSIQANAQRPCGRQHR